METNMVYYKDLNSESINAVLKRYGLNINCLNFDREIPHSFWGAPEAGRLKNTLYVRGDTPIHSILHESAHYVCMSQNQRECNEVDAQGTYAEENATCYLQIMLADYIEGYCRQQAFKDMDAWGYSFRLGSAFCWFTDDAEEVKYWLIQHDIISSQRVITWNLRI